MCEAEVSPNLSPLSRSTQTPMQMRPEATSPYKEMNVSETFSFLIGNARNAAPDAAAMPLKDVATLLVTLHRERIDCRTAGQRQGAARPKSAMLSCAVASGLTRGSWGRRLYGSCAKVGHRRGFCEEVL
jgi:hypothetical protein